jgi:hypothetical protein
MIEVCYNHVSFSTGGTSRVNEGQLLCLLLPKERTMSVTSCRENPIEIIGSDLQGDGSVQSRKTKSLIKVGTDLDNPWHTACQSNR